MDEQETTRLWNGINKIKDQNSQFQTDISEIKSLLKERCLGRQELCSNKISALNKECGRQLGNVEDQEKRIRALEDWRSRMVGIAAGVGLASGLVSTIFTNLVIWLI